MDIQSVKIPDSLIAVPDSLLPFASTAGGMDNFPRSLPQCMCQLAFRQPHRVPTSLENQTSALLFPVLTEQGQSMTVFKDFLLLLWIFLIQNVVGYIFLCSPHALLLTQSTNLYLFKMWVSYFVATPRGRHGERTRHDPPFMGKTVSRHQKHWGQCWEDATLGELGEGGGNGWLRAALAQQVVFALRPGAREEVMEVKCWRQSAPGRGNSEGKGAHVGENLASLKMLKLEWARVRLAGNVAAEGRQSLWSVGRCVDFILRTTIHPWRVWTRSLHDLIYVLKLVNCGAYPSSANIFIYLYILQDSSGRAGFLMPYNHRGNGGGR